MKKHEVKVGSEFIAKVSGKLAHVRIDRENPYGGWDATNLATKKSVRIKSAQRLRAPAGAFNKALAVVKTAVKDAGGAKESPTLAHGAAGGGESAKDTKAAPKAPKAKRAAKKRDGMSGLDAAAKVLAESAEPLNAKQIVEGMKVKGYWSSDAATPHATIYAAMLIEARKMGSVSRFVKVGRGQWALTTAAKQAK